VRKQEEHNNVLGTETHGVEIFREQYG